MGPRGILLLLSCGILAGCNEPTKVTRDVLVGGYSYKSEDPEAKPSDHNLDHLTLGADGTYDLVQGGVTKPKTETRGAWEIWDSASEGPELLLERSSYPIRVKGGEVRLLIDNDVGIWFAKTK